MNPVRIGIVGCGNVLSAYWAEGQKLAAKGEVEVVAACGRPAQRELLVDRLGVRRFVTDFRELVASPDVDLVVVLTPPSSHFEITRAALLAGKHVLCEKPLAMTLAEADELVALAASGPGLFAAGAVHVAQPDVSGHRAPNPPWRHRQAVLGARAIWMVGAVVERVVLPPRRRPGVRPGVLQHHLAHWLARRGRACDGACGDSNRRARCKRQAGARHGRGQCPGAARLRRGMLRSGDERVHHAAVSVAGSWKCTGARARCRCSATTGTRTGTSFGTIPPVAGRCTRRRPRTGHGPMGCVTWSSVSEPGRGRWPRRNTRGTSWK